MILLFTLVDNRNQVTEIEITSTYHGGFSVITKCADGDQITLSGSIPRDKMYGGEYVVIQLVHLNPKNKKYTDNYTKDLSKKIYNVIFYKILTDWST